MMKKTGFSPLILFFLAAPLAAVSMQAAGDNLEAERETVLRFLEDLASTPGGAAVSGPAGWELGSVGVAGGYARGFLRDANTRPPEHRAFDLGAAGQDAYRANATLQVMTALAGIAAQSVGSPSQAGMAQSLQSYGNTLSASSDPTLSAQGGLMREEASAVNLGDFASAQSFVAAMQALPQESAASPPSPADQAWVAALQQVGASVAAAAGSGLGQAALQALGSWMQGWSGAAPGAGGSASLLGPILSSLGSGGRNTGASGIAGGGAMGGLGGGQGWGNASAFGQTGGQMPAPLAAPSGASSAPLNPGGGAAAGGVLPGNSF